jgi:hypothetical protein
MIFRLKKAGLINHSIPQGYLGCNSQHINILSWPSYFIPLQLPSLQVLAFKAAQDLVGGQNAKDDSKIREICGITHQNPLI